MKSIIKDVAILFAITLVSGFMLGLVYEATKDRIAQAELEAKLAAYEEICSEAETFEETAQLTTDMNAFNESLLVAGFGEFGNVIIDEVVCAKDTEGNVLAYLVTATSSEAYDGTLQVMTGVSVEGEVLGITYLSLTETPGLGLKAQEDKFKNQYAGKTVESFTVVKTGATADNEIDAISGATKTSKAVTGCVNAALAFAAEYSAE